MASPSKKDGGGRRMHDISNTSTDTAHTTTPLQPSSTAVEQSDNHTASLRNRLESLPQELYDEIFALTFTADSDTYEVTNAYRFPVQLHVSRAIRQQFSESYFKNRFHVITFGVLREWLKCLDGAAYALLQDVSMPHMHLPYFQNHHSYASTQAAMEQGFLGIVAGKVEEARKDKLGAVMSKLDRIVEFVDV
ncbi:hypothetical protein PRZ48_014603 [Zasmidium cellare]|uniref:Uncharacterized protein n=1 Tax=Zasmidium cellare TaxID=395010 RepID=A0ABR0DZ76_ZASCE|nr:hypothetical protein PRZ48_014603 [Zasmidium cellare]